MQEPIFLLYQQVEVASLTLKKFNALEQKNIRAYIFKNSLPPVLMGSHEAIKSAIEINNLIAVRQELIANAPPDKLSQSYIKWLHKKLLKGVVEKPGEYSKTQRVISKYKFASGKEKELVSSKKAWVAPPGEICQKAMKDMLDWYNTSSQQDIVLKATELMLRFLQIHPFDDGNGRISRCLFLIALMQSSNKKIREIAPYLIIEYHLEKNKIEWGDMVQTSGDFNVEQIYELGEINQFAISAVRKSIDDLIEFLEFLLFFYFD